MSEHFSDAELSVLNGEAPAASGSSSPTSTECDESAILRLREIHENLAGGTGQSTSDRIGRPCEARLLDIVASTPDVFLQSLEKSNVPGDG